METAPPHNTMSAASPEYSTTALTTMNMQRSNDNGVWGHYNSPLFRILSGEIRNQIYELVLSMPDPIHRTEGAYCDMDRFRLHTVPGVAQINQLKYLCRKMRQETLYLELAFYQGKLVFGPQKFNQALLSTCRDFLKISPQCRAQHLRTILVLDTTHQYLRYGRANPDWRDFMTNLPILPDLKFVAILMHFCRNNPQAELLLVLSGPILSSMPIVQYGGPVLPWIMPWLLFCTDVEPFSSHSGDSALKFPLSVL
ncbi:hypothetical protein BCR34DRAFT_144412 [Clohesyomyces aquaticus]|uniref:Uncharacterized protein n=1 Tax=Clohesyomyces aquaticus TaxID=1231657 RepID=A0A1Y2A0L4_9PLEO|nr:hypothetical protein BCR34DRAFT_144412 [Clohesyomyces aquaticus]